MSDIMLDLETWGTRPGCAIRSIGACAFALDGDGIGETFYVNILDSSCFDAGLTLDEKTVAWWKQQSAEAQAALLVDQKPLHEALWAFSSWFQRVDGERIWSHGANFDVPILEAAYVASGRLANPPWSFWNVRDTRTLFDLAGLDARKTTHRGVKHNALDDARAQALASQAALHRIHPSQSASSTAAEGVFS